MHPNPVFHTKEAEKNLAFAAKPPWTTQRMSDSVRAKMMRAIVPCRMEIEGIDGTWKLNQNKADNVRLRAADQVA